MDDPARSLPPEERAKYYRALSADALQRAVAAPEGEIRETYVTLAMGWARLAEVCAKPEPPILPEQAAEAGTRPDLAVAALGKLPLPSPEED